MTFDNNPGLKTSLIPLIMPQLGESVTECTLTKWLKAVGDPVKEFEAILEVNTDKVDTEIPSPAAGQILELLVPEGATVQAGTVLAFIGVSGQANQSIEIPAEIILQEANPSPTLLTMQLNDVAGLQPPVAPPAAVDRSLGFVSPLVKRMARQHGLDLHQIHGSGAHGRITKQDVLDYMATASSIPTSSQTAELTATIPLIRQPIIAPTSTGPFPLISLPGDEIRPHSPIRRAIAEHMVFSERSAPHVTTVMEADLSRVVAHRQGNKAAFTRNGVNLTFTTYFCAAVVAALKIHPLVNSSWSEQGILVHHIINLGLATSLGEAGLIVPVIKNAEELSLLELAGAINDLAERARARQLKPDEVKGGTFTITNHGTGGSLFAMPIINQPQCAILGIGTIQKRPVVISDPSGGDALAIRPMVYLSLTFDHRILDGATADIFLSKVVELLENWDKE